MKTRVLFFLAVNLVTLSGCATATSTRSVTANLAAEHGASAALVETLQRGGRLTLTDIQKLANLQIPDDATLAYLRDSGAAYQLTTAQIDQLRAGEVSNRVIDYLLATPAQAARIVQRSRVRFGFGFGYPHYGGSGHYYSGSGHGFGHSGFSHRGGRH
jgi:hypothetical protein